MRIFKVLNASNNNNSGFGRCRSQVLNFNLVVSKKYWTLAKQQKRIPREGTGGPLDATGGPLEATEASSRPRTVSTNTARTPTATFVWGINITK